MPWLILITLSLVWGSSFILMKRGMDAFSDTEVAALRISIASLSLAPLLIKHRGIDFKKFWPGLVMMGVFGNLIPAFLFTAAETKISSSLAGMLNALTPIFTLLVGMVWLKSKPKRTQVTGLILGFLAASALLLAGTGGGSMGHLGYGLLVVLATFSYALSVNSIRYFLGGLAAIPATAWAFAIIGLPALVYLFGFTEFTHHVQNQPKAYASLGYICILAIVGTAMSVILFNVLIRQAGALFASTCTYLIPIVAVMWGLVDGEQVQFSQLICIACVILSVYLINGD